MEDIGFDVASRRLCPDGSCTGIIGPDGKCSECGRAPQPVAASELSAAEGAAGPLASATPDEEPFFADEAPDAADVVTFDANRPLCSDGSCVGVLGANGRCGVCGKTGRAS